MGEDVTSAILSPKCSFLISFFLCPPHKKPSGNICLLYLFILAVNFFYLWCLTQYKNYVSSEEIVRRASFRCKPFLSPLLLFLPSPISSSSSSSSPSLLPSSPLFSSSPLLPHFFFSLLPSLSDLMCFVTLYNLLFKAPSNFPFPPHTYIHLNIFNLWESGSVHE